jgi:CubicO group peptidase (beta-lactamase class C family)
LSTSPLKRASTLAVLAFLAVAAQPQDDLDRFIQSQMAMREIVGLSLAIIDDGKVVDARAYGTTSRNGGTPVTPATLFQAGSISKPVAALAALQLVEKGKLSLDENVNDKLKTWKVPDNEFTTTEKVTLRRLLSHSAGLTVHGFPGYAATERMPTATEVLDGKGNTPAVRVNLIPGSTWRYSGGGYTVMQQLVSDVSGKPFADYMRDHVLQPLAMTNSTYEQPLPPRHAEKTAAGHRVDRSAVVGRWHVYPEMAAAGLWTTPTDLAKYAIGVQQALAGKSKVLSAGTAREMLTVQKGTHGLGPGLAGSGATLRFNHGGRDEGFDATLVAYAETGDGVVVMINANDNSRAIGRIVNYIAKKYNWPDFQMPTPEAVSPVALAPAALNAVTGRYEFANNFIMTLMAKDGRIYLDVSGLPDEEFVAAANDRFVSAERAVSFKPVRNAAGEIEALEWHANNNVRRIPRIGPLFPTSTPADPDAALTARVLGALGELARGNEAVTASTLLTPGARKVFTAANPQLRDISQLTLAHVEDVAGRGIVRHEHPIATVRQYRMTTPQGARLLIVHFDADGLVADYDIVSR